MNIYIYKLILLSILLTTNVYAMKVISENKWCTGNAKCTTVIKPNNMYLDTFSVKTYLLDQYGYQGLINKIGSSHAFYAYNTSPSRRTYIFNANLCDMTINCVNYMKEVSLDWREYYGEIIYNTLDTISGNVGMEPLYANTIIEGSNIPGDHAQASLILKPFPYDG